MVAHVLKYESQITEVVKINPQFSKVKIRILYTGLNRNNTYFSKETVENMLYSLPLIPIVGEWKEKIENFGGHGGKLEISSDGIQWIETTKPYGVVGENCDYGWETVTESDGVLHEYLYCYGYLWTSRYPEAEKVITDGANHSMEVNVNKGEWINGYYNIEDAVFSALCILGKSDNPNENTEPCFESSSIVAYSLDKDTFKKEFNQMIFELKSSLSQNQPSDVEVDNINIKEGGSNVDKLTLFTKFPTLTEDMVADLKANLDNYSYEELEVKLTELFEAQQVQSNATDVPEVVVAELVADLTTQPVPETIPEVITAQLDADISTNSDVAQAEPAVEAKTFQLIYELSHDDIRGKIYDIINPIGADGYREYKYWIMEVFQTYFIAEDSNTYEHYYKFPYAISEDETVTVGEATEIFAKWLTAEEVAQLEQLEQTKSALQAELDTLKTDLSELNEYKANILKAEKEAQVEELFSNFSEFAEEEAYQALKTNAMNIELTELETALFALAGRKKFSIKKEETTRISIHSSNNSDEPYGSASRYFDK